MERCGEREGLTLDGDLPLLHRLEQRRLGLRRGPIDLVGEQQAGEDRATSKLEARRALVEDERAGEVGRKQVRGELGALEIESERLGERTCGERLAEPREVLDEDVAAGQDRRQNKGQRFALADNGLTDLVEDIVGERRNLSQVEIGGASATTSECRLGS